MPESPWPLWLEPVPSFSREELHRALLQATRAGWLEALRDHEHETFYAFALCLAEDDLELHCAAASEQGLRRVAAAADGGALEQRLQALRWSQGAWPYVAIEPFAQVTTLLGELRDALGKYMNPDLAPSLYERRWDSHWAPFMQSLNQLYLSVLEELDSQGCFVMQPSRVVLCVSGSDDACLKRSVQRLNPAHQAERVLRELKLGFETRARVEG